MSIIKAGTYRFNDVLTEEYPRGEHNLNFTVSSYVAQLGIDVTADCFKINMLSDAGDIAFYFKSTIPDLSSYGMTYPNFFWVYDPVNGWSVDAYGYNILTITIPYDQDVSDEFYEWFAANAKVYTTISGTWIIKDIPRFDNELLEFVNFISNGKTYLAFRLHMGSTQSEIFYAYSESGADQAYIDWYYDLEGNEVLYEWSNNAYKTIEFVGEQSVSQQFVDWLTANARNTAGIDFSTLQGLTIPEGVVTRITDESGIIIWRHRHSFLTDWVVDKAATCLDDGARHRNCATCDYIHNEIIKALGHKYVEYVVIDHTCTTPAIQKYKCIRCDEDKPFESSDIIRPAPGHKWGDPYYSSEFSSEYGHKCTVCGELEELDYVECQHPDSARSEVITNPATCTTVGIKTCSCNVCGSSWSEEIEALGHSFTLYLSDNNATCFADGTKTAKCNRCTETHTVVDTGSKLEHILLDNWVIDKAATCTEKGVEKRYCQRECGYFEARYIDMIAHSYNSVVTDPTCTTGGYTTYTCSSCGHSYTSDETEAKGHNWGIYGGWSTVTPATCTTNGLEKHTCMTCLLEETREIIAKGHTEVVDKAVDATCTEDGWTEGKHCSVCGEVIVKQQKVDKLGHDPGDPKLTNTPTCNVCAHYKVVCKRCEETLDEYDDDGEFGDHSWGDPVEFKPKCTEDGYTRHICSVCNLVEDYDKTPALGHDYQLVSDSSTSSGAAMKCTRCGDSYEADYDCDILGHETNEGEYDTDDGTAFKCMHCGEFYN